MDRHELKDDFGRLFWVVVDDDDAERIIFRIRRASFVIGHVMTRAYYSAWHINDFVIERTTSEQIMLGPLPVLPARIYRNRDRGIGTRVMQFVIQEARRRGIRQITGEVVPEKPEDAEALKRFYIRLGFRIEPAGESAMNGAVARFVMDIEPETEI